MCYAGWNRDRCKCICRSPDISGARDSACAICCIHGELSHPKHLLIFLAAQNCLLVSHMIQQELLYNPRNKLSRRVYSAGNFSSAAAMLPSSSASTL